MPALFSDRALFSMSMSMRFCRSLASTPFSNDFLQLFPPETVGN